MKRLWLVGLLIVCASLTAHSQELAKQQRDWVRLNSEIGRFTVLLPQMPVETIETVESNVGPYTSHLFSVRSNPTIFVIGWVDYDRSFSFGPQSELNANRDNFIKGIKGILVSSNYSTFDGYQSLDFTAENNDTIYQSRVLIVGRRPYLLFTGTLKGVDDSANTARFFESFKVKQPN